MGDGVICDGWRGQMVQQAVLYDNVDFLECLLDGDEIDNINSCDSCGRTATYTAVSNNSLKCLKLLLEHGGEDLKQSSASTKELTIEIKRQLSFFWLQHVY